MNYLTTAFSKPTIATQTSAKMHYHSPITLNSPWGRASLAITMFAVGIILAAATGSHWTVLYACGGSLAGIGVLGLLTIPMLHLYWVCKVKRLLKQESEEKSTMSSEWNTFFERLSPYQSMEVKSIDERWVNYILHKSKKGKRQIHALMPN